MSCTDTPSFTVVSGSAFIVAMRWINLVTGGDFEQADVFSIVETVTDTVTGDSEDTMLDKTEVVFDTLQTHPLVQAGQHRHNVRVLVPADRLAVEGREYRYQLTIVPSGGEGGGATSYTQKSAEIVVAGS